MLLVQSAIGQELDPLKQLSQHEVNKGDRAADQVIVRALILEVFHERLHFLHAIVSNCLLGLTL